MKKDGRVMTATVFAEEMGVSYPTVVRWLKRRLVPGAVLRESPDRGKWWEIPEAALAMERPKTGPKPAAVTDDQDATEKPKRRASNRTAAKKALKKMGKGGAAK